MRWWWTESFTWGFVVSKGAYVRQAIFSTNVGQQLMAIPVDSGYWYFRHQSELCTSHIVYYVHDLITRQRPLHTQLDPQLCFCVWYVYLIGILPASNGMLHIRQRILIRPVRFLRLSEHDSWASNPLSGSTVCYSDEVWKRYRSNNSMYGCARLYAYIVVGSMRRCGV